MATGKSIFVRIFGDNKNLKKSVNESNTQLQSFQKNVMKIGAAVGIAFGAQQLLKFGAETVKLAASAEGVRRAFDRIAYSGLLDEMQRATKNTVSELELMKRAVQANNFKIPLNQLATLFEFAAKRAQDTGESVDYLVNSLVAGIGRKSVLVLDNLGISAVELREKLGETSMEMAGVGEIADAVGKIAQESMRETGGVVDDVNTKLQQMRTEWELTKEKLGKGLISAFAYLKQGYTDLRDFITFYTEEGVTSVQQLFGKTKEEILAAKPFMKDHGDDWKSIYEEIEEAKKRVESYFKLTDVKFKGSAPKAGLLSMGLLTQEIGSITTVASLEQKLTALREKARGATMEEAGAINYRIKLLEAEKTALENKITYEGYSAEQKEDIAAVNDYLNAQSKTTNEIATENIATSEKEVEGLLAKEEALENVTRAMTEQEIAAKKLSLMIKDTAINVGVFAAESLGAAAAGAKSFGEALADIGIMIAGALGDILIYAGTLAGPAGLPLILGGLALKGISAFAGAKLDQARSSGAFGATPATVAAGMSSFKVSGQDLVTSYNASNGFRQRVT